MVIHSKGTCQACKAADGNMPRQETVEQIGNQVFTESIVGRGTDRTDYSFFQCKQCGSIWLNYEESGAGGHGGPWWKRLTKEFF